jgi:hypothetical protein
MGRWRQRAGGLVTALEIPLRGTVAELVEWLRRLDQRAEYTLTTSVGIPEFGITCVDVGCGHDGTRGSALPVELVSPS